MVGHIFLDQYQAVRLLGEGGMGQVYFGRQLNPAREVVVKVMHARIAGTPRFRETFDQETLLMRRLQHPRIVEFVDAGVDAQHGPCIVMEFLAGVPLESYRRKQRCFDPGRVGHWLAHLASALHFAHGLGIVHRDLKPENLMVLGLDTPDERIKVMDFGLAQLAAAPHIALDKLTGSRNHIGGGTPDYLPPEQVRGDPVDQRGDIYSIGVMLFQLLTGRLPFTGKEIADVLLAHVEQPPPRFADAAPAHEVPAAVEALVQQCLAKYPNERPQSARELALRYEKALGVKLLSPDDFAPPASADPPLPTNLAPPGESSPDAVVHHLEAWLPESMAVLKLRGFAQDTGGEIVESAPGLIRLRFRDGAAAAPARGGLFSWFSRSENAGSSAATSMELHLQKKASDRQNLLLITVLLRPEGDRTRARDPQWQTLADERFRNLRAYLSGR